MDRIANDLVKIAESLTASEKTAYSKTVDDFIKLLRSGRYKWAAFFPGKSRPGKLPESDIRVKKISDENLRQAVVEIKTLKVVDEGLIVTIVGTRGRTDTYVFTMVPYEEAFGIKNVEDDDPMAKEKVSKMWIELHKWTNKKLMTLPGSAPVGVQLMEAQNDFDKRLKGKMGLRGRKAVEAVIAAMSGLYTTDAPPLRRLWRKYGDEVEDMLIKYRLYP